MVDEEILVLFFTESNQFIKLELNLIFIVTCRQSIAIINTLMPMNCSARSQNTNLDSIARHWKPYILKQKRKLLSFPPTLKDILIACRFDPYQLDRTCTVLICVYQYKTIALQPPKETQLISKPITHLIKWK